MKQFSRFLTIHPVLLALAVFFTACGVQEPATTRYKRKLAADAARQQNSQTRVVVASSQGEEDRKQPTAEEEAELALRLEGKSIYDGTCMQCHQDVDITTVNSRDPARITSLSESIFHESVQNIFPTLEEAEAIVAYLDNPL